MRPLEGVRILDFSQYHGATFATMLLADFGAEVIKIEKPVKGDNLRSSMPLKDGYSGYHAYLNRGKKSFAIDFSSKKGMTIIKEIVKDVDVICENFRYGTLEKYGLGYGELKKANKKLIYATLTGFGSKGENKDKACFDNTAQAFSSMLDMTGAKGGAPVTIGAQLGNLYGGLHLAMAINLAMIHLHNTGEGQFIDVSCIDSLMSALEDGMVNCTITGHKHERNGNLSQAMTPYDTYKTKDGYVSIGVSTEFQWEKFCKVMGLESITNDPRYNSNEKRCINYNKGLREMIENITITMTKSEIEQLLSSVSIPCGAVCTIAEVIDSQQIREREMIIEVNDRMLGEMKQFGIPAKLYKTPGYVKDGAPILGENTAEYLRSLGYSANLISDLHKEGVVDIANS